MQTAPSRLSCGTDCNEEPFEVQCIPTADVVNQWENLNIIKQQGWVLARTFLVEKVMNDPDLARYFSFDPVKPVSS
ncbi:unnamed protein product [Hydatigera taeniaeformis]|uniref:Uncharacterized protein n=1 Tax=Hydatigena taeniaeformis TaxID=6205 RepID=A0A3P7FDJ2_HYDTA|nr:unnamed protein product [Hydatigera taeniaeformis]